MSHAVPGRPACRFCDAPLSPHQAVKGVCDAPKCQMRRVQTASRAVFQRDWGTYVGKQRKAVESAAAELSTAAARLGGIDGVAIGVVPAQDRPIVPVPDNRRQEFAAYLDEIITKAFEEGPPEPDILDADRGEAPEQPIIDATCATCWGKCCILGGPAHAFLTSNNVQRYRSRNPGASPAAIKTFYLDQIPDVSVEHSCIYHGARGCVLSRSDRGDVCNAYHCNPQTQLFKRVNEAGASRAIVVANEGDAGPRVSIWTAETGMEMIEADPDVEQDLKVIDAALTQIPPDLPEQGTGKSNKVPTCDWCGQPIDPHLAMTTRSCGRESCEKKRIEDIGARVTRQKHERYVAKQRKVIAGSEENLALAAERLGTTRDNLLIGVVPHQNRPVEPLSEDRRAAFEEHLVTLAAEAFAIPDPENYHSDENREIIDPDEDPIADACCATCQGSCCTLGGETHAFLDKYEVSRFRLTTHDPTPEKFVAHYLGKLPERSVRNSCVYQTDIGCNLPREERASICNTFQCKGLKMLVESFEKSDKDRAVVLAHRDTAPRAVGLFTEASGWEPLVRFEGQDD